VEEILKKHRSDASNPKRPQYPSVSVFGVVVGFNVPTRTKTDSWMVTITIVDQSLSKESSHNGDELCAMNINIFRKNCKDFPKCRRAGDVIRLQEAGIQVSRLFGSQRGYDSDFIF
jgi:Telomeric single stranded DNA binding POT1/CDC13